MPEQQGKQGYRQMRFTRPPGSTELLLIRHGESEPVVPGRPFPLVDGHGDPALAPEGRVQAEQIADRLAGRHPIDAIYVTTLRRTVQTAAPLAARLGLDPVVEPDLREVNLGEWEGELYRQHVAEGHPLALRMLKEQRWDIIPGAESAESLHTRVRGALDRLVTAHPGECVAVFTHGGVIGEILAQVTQAGRPFAFLGASNGSISQIVAFAGRWILRRFNDTAHLAGDLDRDPDLPGA
jgi:2,3-bisphosphoglycerate-dependent phosphoglycerate mutase